MAEHDKILILDFGSQYSHLIARRVREHNVYSELRQGTIAAEEIKAFNPKGIILSGGPGSVYEEGAPKPAQEIWDRQNETAGSGAARSQRPRALRGS